MLAKEHSIATLPRLHALGSEFYRRYLLGAALIRAGHRVLFSDHAHLAALPNLTAFDAIIYTKHYGIAAVKEMRAAYPGVSAASCVSWK